MLDFVNNSGVLSLEMVGPRSKSCNLMIVGRGISAGSSEQHPLAERQQTSNYPRVPSERKQRHRSVYVSPSISEQSSPVEDDDDDEEDTPNNQLMLSNSGWTTGNSTERSSLFSWADDEFDQQAARTVRRMFEEIDSMLYEVAKPINAGSTLQNECKDWKNSFHISENVVQSRTTGHLVQDEEVIEADGIVEEYLAYDRSWSSEEGHEQKQYHAPRRRRGFPPITPNACRQNSVCSNAFDVLWEEIVGWLRFLVKRQIEDYTGRNLLDQPVGKLAPMGSGLRFSAGPSLNFNLYDQKSALNGVMTISSKALHNRLGDKERTPLLFGDEGAFPYQRPNSSSFFPKGGRPGSTKFSDLMVHNSRLSSARVGKSRLKPLERAKTPALDSVVTGKKIMAVGDRLVSPPQPLSSSPPRNWSRNATLPPIEQVQESNLTRENLKFPRGSARIRISSAVTADDRRQAPKERIAPFVFDTRPNTTHSFTTDMPMGGIARRCSTPHFQGVQTSKPGTPSAQGAPHFMSGITGVSLGIPGTTSQMETQHYETAPPLSSYLRLL
ncbi:hypothetical protein BSL78_18683 [Apostichopus japonicus]|uniref:DUF3719 domain-containing protein n=1 Tax=Stichopus japonicus TaxID=307972 RepID=A0A2G8K924_STIJA|nr:hypothetical protein BSL78_18683 [Apostichopus japonicus]